MRFSHRLKHTAFGILITGLAALILILLIKVFSVPSTPARLILITIDTLRADRLGCYGYGRKTSPNIDRLAQKSFLFTNAVTPRAKTVPALASMLTGLYPHSHGIRTNWVPLDGKFETVAEILRREGFRTGAVVCNFMARAKYSGLDQGFEDYDDRMPSRELNRNIREKTAEQVYQAASRWLEENRKENFFLWVHYQDPHGPYTPPPKYHDTFRDKREDPVKAKKVLAYQHLPGTWIEPGVLDAEMYRTAYDREIRYCDDYIGKLLDKVEELNLDDNTCIILTSDHGESLGEHDYYFEHGRYVYDQCGRVPLLIHIPSETASRTIKDQVNIMSINPTIIELLGVSPTPEVEASSLLPLLKDRSSRGDEFIFMESLNRYKAVRTDRWKYILNIMDGTEELYDLADDPAESQNLATREKQRAVSMRRRLEAWLTPNDAIPIKEIHEMKINEEERKALLSLGYIQ